VELDSSTDTNSSEVTCRLLMPWATSRATANS
jgi:hypothetical protein